MGERSDARLFNAIRQVAPGTALRDGLDRIIQGGKGALIVIDDGPEVLRICSGGFLIDSPFSPQRLSELAKMDGAIILAGDAGRIARANVHLVPDHRMPTTETGTRHRTAERVARTIDVPVISVSEQMLSIAVYIDGQKHPLERSAVIIQRAEQALRTLERYRGSLAEASAALTALEVQEQVRARDVVAVLQYAELVSHIGEDVELDILELGREGRLTQLQLTELMDGVADDRWFTLRDYLPGLDDTELDQRFDRLSSLEGAELFDPASVAVAVGLITGEDLDGPVVPQGYRMLSRLPRLLSEAQLDAVVAAFGELPKILRASAEDLVAVGDITPARAKAIIEGLTRLSESARSVQQY